MSVIGRCPAADRVVRLSHSKYHVWKQEAECDLDNMPCCPRRSSQPLTLTEASTIKEMVTSKEYRQVPTGTLGLIAQRLGKVFFFLQLHGTALSASTNGGGLPNASTQHNRKSGFALTVPTRSGMLPSPVGVVVSLQLLDPTAALMQTRCEQCERELYLPRVDLQQRPRNDWGLNSGCLFRHEVSDGMLLVCLQVRQAR